MTNSYCKCIQEKIARYKFEGYETEKQTVRDSILRTIEFGTSMVVLVVGPQGVGKTTMINEILKEIDTRKDIKEQYQVIKFNGYLQETDELALQHLVQSLNNDLVSENEFRGSAAEYLTYVIESLRQADGTKKALVMVFDNFNIFCDHEKRLLYNLLDIVNRQSAAICAIGLARNNTCLEALHERTQSRLTTVSNVYLHSKTNPENRLALIQRLFSVDKPSAASKNWNKTVERICSSSEMRELIENILELDSREGFFVQFLNHSLLYIDEEDSLSVDTFKNAYNDFDPEHMKLDYGLKNLTTLDLCLVIAIYHRCVDHDTHLFNFETIYEYYKTVVKKASGKLPLVDRLLAMKSFQNLKRQGYIRLKRVGDSDSTAIEYDVHELLISREKVRDRIKNLPNLSADLQQWIDNSLHSQ